MPEPRFLRPFGGAVGLVLLAASLWQLLPALIDPAQARTALLPVAAVALLAISVGVARPEGRHLAWPVQGAIVAGTGLAVAVAGLLAGQPVGPLQLALVLGGLTVAIAGVPIGWLAARPARPHRGRTAEVVALSLIVVVFGGLAIRNVAIGAPMGWDESVYGLTARSWIAGTPNTGWALHRSPGMPALGTIPLLFVQSDALLRAWGVAFGVAMIVATWALGRIAGGPAVGLVAAAAVASVPDLQADAARFLTDVPSTAILLAMTALLLWQLTREGGPGRGLLVVAALGAAAFYIRYGASIPIALVGLVALVTWSGRLRGRLVLVGGAVALLVALVAPNLIAATLATGTPWGVAMSARSLAAPAYPGQALRAYLGIFGGDLAGSTIALLAWAALLGWIATLVDAVRLRRVTTTLRSLTLLVVPALAQGLVLGVAALPQTRYVFFPIVLLVIAGTLVMTRVVVAVGRNQSHIARHVEPWPIVGVVVMGLLLAAASGGVNRVARDAETARSSLTVLADAITADAAGQPCSVLTYVVPQVTWYTRCAGYNFRYPARVGAETQLTGSRRYLLLFSGDAGGRQPTGDDRSYYLALAQTPPIAVIQDRASAGPDAEVYRLR